MTTLPEFQIPKISSEKVTDNRGTFTIEPLDKGFGYTFGNSLRRVLLSSLGGAAIKSVRIEGVAHEFSDVSGVKEDVTDMVLNLKDIVIRMHTDADEVEAPLVAAGPGEVKAKDIDLPAGVEILNPDVSIATTRSMCGASLRARRSDCSRRRSGASTRQRTTRCATPKHRCATRFCGSCSRRSSDTCARFRCRAP